MTGLDQWSLAWSLARRDLRSRYQESLLGFLWSLLSPLLLIGIYTLFFGRLLGIQADPDAPPFALHLFCGYLVWDLFGRLAGEGADILLGSRTILTRVRLPLATVFYARLLYHAVHWAFAVVVLLVAMLASGLVPGPQLLMLLPLVGLLGLFALGVAMLFAVLGLFLRDLREVFAVLLTAWLFATPIFYYADRLPLLNEGLLGTLYHLNPLYWFVTAVRDAALHARGPEPVPFLLLALSSLFVFWAGRTFLRRCRRLVMDLL